VVEEEAQGTAQAEAHQHAERGADQHPLGAQPAHGAGQARRRAGDAGRALRRLRRLGPQHDDPACRGRLRHQQRAGEQAGEHPELLADRGEGQVLGRHAEEDHADHRRQADGAEDAARGVGAGPGRPAGGSHRAQEGEQRGQAGDAGAEQLGQVAVVHELDQRPRHLGRDDRARAQPRPVPQQRGQEEALPEVDAGLHRLGDAQAAAGARELGRDPPTDLRPQDDRRGAEHGHASGQRAPRQPAAGEQDHSRRQGQDGQGRVRLAAEHREQVGPDDHRQPQGREAGMAHRGQRQRQHYVEEPEGADRAVVAQQRVGPVDLARLQGQAGVVGAEQVAHAGQVQGLGKGHGRDREAGQHAGVEEQPEVGRREPGAGEDQVDDQVLDGPDDDHPVGQLDRSPREQDHRGRDGDAGGAEGEDHDVQPGEPQRPALGDEVEEEAGGHDEQQRLVDAQQGD
jgi:hypothetical protein